jgi:hypothetical protein
MHLHILEGENDKKAKIGKGCFGYPVHIGDMADFLNSILFRRKRLYVIDYIYTGEFDAEGRLNPKNFRDVGRVVLRATRQLQELPSEDMTRLLRIVLKAKELSQAVIYGERKQWADFLTQHEKQLSSLRNLIKVKFVPMPGYEFDKEGQVFVPKKQD